MNKFTSSLLALLIVPCVAEATVLYSNFTGAGDDEFKTDEWYNIEGPGRPSSFEYAGRFTPTVDGLAHSIDIPVSSPDGSPAFTVYLATDSFDVPDTILTTGNGVAPSSPEISIVNVVLGPMAPLSTSEEYWVWVAHGADETSVDWYEATNNGTYGITTDQGTSWSTEPGVSVGAFRVNAIPEPGSLTLLGLAGMALLRRRR